MDEALAERILGTAPQVLGDLAWACLDEDEIYLSNERLLACLAELHRALGGRGHDPAGRHCVSGRLCYGAVRVEKLSRMRQTIARNMIQSYTTIPQLTNFDDADVTELEDMREQSKADYADRGIKLTSLPFLIKAVASALKRRESRGLHYTLDYPETALVAEDTSDTTYANQLVVRASDPTVMSQIEDLVCKLDVPTPVAPPSSTWRRRRSPASSSRPWPLA